MIPRMVTARTAKRCPVCHTMVARGTRALLTDDRFTFDGTTLQHATRRAAFHLTHPACYYVPAPVPATECPTR